MATPICTNCENEVGVIMATMLADGDTIVIGAQCLPGYALTLAEVATREMTPKTAAEYGEQFDAVAANDTRPRATSAPTAGKRSRKASPVPTVVDAPLVDAELLASESQESSAPEHGADGGEVDAEAIDGEVKADADNDTPL